MLNLFGGNCLLGEVLCALLNPNQQKQAERLQKDRLVSIWKTEDGICVQPNLEDIDRWVREQLNRIEKDFPIHIYAGQPPKYLIYEEWDHDCLKRLGSHTRKFTSAKRLDIYPLKTTKAALVSQIFMKILRDHAFIFIQRVVYSLRDKTGVSVESSAPLRQTKPSPLSL